MIFKVSWIVAGNSGAIYENNLGSDGLVSGARRNHAFDDDDLASFGLHARDEVRQDQGGVGQSTS